MFPKNSYVEILTHGVMVLGGGLYEDSLGHGGGALMIGLLPL